MTSPISMDFKTASGKGLVIQLPIAALLAQPCRAGVRAVPNDVTGCFLEMGADGKWAGPSVGSFPSRADLDALPAEALAALSVGVSAEAGGVTYTWQGSLKGWGTQGERIVAPLATILASAPSNPSVAGRDIRAVATDYPTCDLRWDASALRTDGVTLGAWIGNLGNFADLATVQALPTTYLAQVGVEAYPMIGGVLTKCKYVPYTGWVVTQDPITLGVSKILTDPQLPINTPGGWGFLTAGVASLTNERSRKSGRPVLKIDATSTSGNTWVGFKRKVSVGSFCGPIEFWYNIDLSFASGWTLLFRYSSDVPVADPPTVVPSNYVQATAFNAVTKPGAWSRVVIDPQQIGSQESTLVSITGSPVLNTVNYIDGIVYFPASIPSAQRIVYIDTAEVGAAQRTKIFFTFDGAPAEAKRIDSFFASRALKRPAIFNDTNTPLSAQRIADSLLLINRGWEIGSNGSYHRDYTANTDLLDSDCAFVENAFTAAGLPKPTLFGCPLNANNGQVDVILKTRGYRGCRGTGNRQFLFDVDNPYQSFATISIEYGATSDTLLSRIDSAISTGSHLTFHFHQVVDTITDSSVQILTSVFTALLDGIVARRNQGLLDVTSMGDFCRMHR